MSPVQRDHRQIVEFENEEDRDFTLFYKRVGAIIKKNQGI